MGGQRPVGTEHQQTEANSLDRVVQHGQLVLGVVGVDVHELSLAADGAPQALPASLPFFVQSIHEVSPKHERRDAALASGRGVRLGSHQRYRLRRDGRSRATTVPARWSSSDCLSGDQKAGRSITAIASNRASTGRNDTRVGATLFSR
jgi:hypothetical protein